MREGKCLQPFITEDKKLHPSIEPIVNWDDGRPVYRKKHTGIKYEASLEFSWYTSELHDKDSYFCYVNG